MRLLRDRPNHGALDGATHVGREGVRGGGAYFYVYLEVTDGEIRRASFESNGCQTSMAVGAALTNVLIGRKSDLARSVEEEDLLALLGGIPEGKQDVPGRAVRALRNAFEIPSNR